ncbi:hypothetical protein T01_12418 [Trichinella spiralis]|uniref:Uncharacterized protein n=1 Tax=Trichinella spiralis TaxID=6334 RepID=A0A0V1B1B5_TRISP|nr:hypothetical protein T01_12418 [Trichinella spiralis]
MSQHTAQDSLMQSDSVPLGPEPVHHVADLWIFSQIQSAVPTRGLQALSQIKNPKTPPKALA